MDSACRNREPRGHARLMTLFDYTVLTIVSASVVLSVMRGFTRELLALLAWVAAFVAATTASGTVAGWLANSISDESLRALTAFVVVFIGTLLLVSVAGLLLSRAVRSAGLGVEDRLLGAIFGLARGLLIVMVGVLLAGLTPLPKQPAWVNAMLSPPLEALAGALKPWLPQVFSRNISYN
jgi:membrane protein required for colicin V production